MLWAKQFIPLLVVKMHHQLYQKAKENISNMSQANYFYLIAYPTYSGYRVEHNPTFTIYLSPASAALTPPNWGGILVIGAKTFPSFFFNLFAPYFASTGFVKLPNQVNFRLKKNSYNLD